jgi:hypothetical protein
MFYLYAYTINDGSICDLAIAGTHETSEEANINRNTQMTCYSDEGINFAILDYELPKVTCSYDELVERCAK